MGLQQQGGVTVDLERLGVPGPADRDGHVEDVRVDLTGELRQALECDHRVL